MARSCLDFTTGGLRHFPAGSYDEQVKRPYGPVELDTMDLLYQCWHAFGVGDVTTWAGSDLTLTQWMAETEAQIDDKRLNGLIERLWLTTFSTT